MKSIHVISRVFLLFTALFLSQSAFAVTADDVVCDKCVGITDLANNSVKTGKIKNGTIKMEDLSPEIQNKLNAIVPANTVYGAAMMSGTYALVAYETWFRDSPGAGSPAEASITYLETPTTNRFFFDGVSSATGSIRESLVNSDDGLSESASTDAQAFSYTVSGSGVLTLIDSDPECTESIKGPVAMGGQLAFIRSKITCSFASGEIEKSRGLWVLVRMGD